MMQVSQWSLAVTVKKNIVMWNIHTGDASQNSSKTCEVLNSQEAKVLDYDMNFLLIEDLCYVVELI